MRKFSQKDQEKMIALMDWRISIEEEQAKNLPGVQAFRDMVETDKQIVSVLRELFAEEKEG